LRIRSINFRSRYLIAIGAIFVVSISIILFDPLQDAITNAAGSFSISGLRDLSNSATATVIATINATGYLGIFGLMLLEGTSLPVPSFVVLPFAGYLVSIGRLEFWTIVGIATVGGMIGAFVDYYIGMFLGMRAIANYGGKFFISPEQMHKMELLFQRHGGRIVFLSRLIPGVRALSSFPAGSAKMNLPKFTLYSTLGYLILNVVLVYIGDYLGAHWDAVRAAGIVEIGATVIVLLVGLWLFIRFRKQPTDPAKPVQST
jgi:membrane protein DedA with SNARE-associated domain